MRQKELNFSPAFAGEKFTHWSELLLGKSLFSAEKLSELPPSQARAIEKEAMGLFSLPEHPIPLWLSPLSDEGVLLGEMAMETARAYRNLEAEAESGVMPDHLGLIFQFSGWICRALEAQPGQANAERLMSVLARLSKLTCSVLPRLEQELGNAGCSAYFTNWVEEIERVLGVLQTAQIPPQTQSGTGAPLPPLPPGFRSAGPERPQRTVRTSGWGNCGGRCAITVQTAQGAILSLGTEPFGACSLTACSRGENYRGTFLNPYRLRVPLRRVGPRGEGKFVPITWEEATDEIAFQLQRIKEEYGPAARYVQYATGVSGAMRGDHCAKRLFALDGGYLDYYNNYSDPCARAATEYTYGTIYSGNSPQDYRHAELILLWGFNPAESVFGTGTMAALADAAAQGVPVISIDPRYTDTAAALRAEWIPIRPSTDGALAVAMAYVLLTEGLCNRDFLDRFCQGFDRDTMPPGAKQLETVCDYLTGARDGVPKTPSWGSALTGIPEETILRLARSYAGAKPAALLNGYGLQRHGNGEQSVRCCLLLACMTGNVGLSGGGAAGAGRIPVHTRPQFPIPPNPCPASIPCFLWTKAVREGRLMTPRDGLRGAARLESDIKLILNLAGNTLLNQHGDINATAKLLRDTAKVEYIVCSDLFLTPSARYADLLLPGVSPFEMSNLNPPWEKGNYLLYGAKLIDPLFDCRPEYDWLAEVAEKMGLGPVFTEGIPTAEGWIPRLYEEMRKKEPELPQFSAFAAQGGHRYPPQEPFIAFHAQRENGVPFPTMSGKIELYSPALAALGREGVPPIPQYIPAPEGPEDPLRREFPLQLVGWHEKRRCNSTHDNNLWENSESAPSVWLHPEDAAARGIGEGAEVLVWNRRGSVRLPARLTRRVMPGTAAMAQGGWYTPDARGIDRRGCINVLTSQMPTPLAFGNGQHTNLVQIRLWEEG